MIECYYDDFIAICQVKSAIDLQHISQAMLHGIKSIFPDGISISKLHKDGH